jgi:hypothetical protein
MRHNVAAFSCIVGCSQLNAIFCTLSSQSNATAAYEAALRKPSTILGDTLSACKCGLFLKNVSAARCSLWYDFNGSNTLAMSKQLMYTKSPFYGLTTSRAAPAKPRKDKERNHTWSRSQNAPTVCRRMAMTDVSFCLVDQLLGRGLLKRIEAARGFLIREWCRKENKKERQAIRVYVE